MLECSLLSVQIPAGTKQRRGSARAGVWGIAALLLCSTGPSLWNHGSLPAGHRLSLKNQQELIVSDYFSLVLRSGGQHQVLGLELLCLCTVPLEKLLANKHL